MTAHLKVSFWNPKFSGAPGISYLDKYGQPRFHHLPACTPPENNQGFAFVSQPGRLTCQHCKELWQLFRLDNKKFNELLGN